MAVEIQVYLQTDIDGGIGLRRATASLLDATKDLYLTDPET